MSIRARLAPAFFEPLSPLDLALDGRANEFSPLFLFAQYGVDARQCSATEPGRRLLFVDSLASHASIVRQDAPSGQLRISTSAVDN